MTNAFNRYLFLKTTSELQLAFKLKFHKYQVIYYQRFFQSSVNTVRKAFRQMLLPFSLQFHRELKMLIFAGVLRLCYRKNLRGCRENYLRENVDCHPGCNISDLDTVCIVPSVPYSFCKRCHPPACERQLVCGTFGKTLS